ncbi:hypothetical protein F2Q69_00015376 [Brassica cretica]|uniref:Uncharacterized protein n=1 Tax=Brassica cretica TaxID=69181 RepID=A0A8S9R8C4_BRACR|nr:hypothetical protein F2Q69_00015376 [Brassica cretica]
MKLRCRLNTTTRITSARLRVLELGSVDQTHDNPKSNHPNDKAEKRNLDMGLIRNKTSNQTQDTAEDRTPDATHR